MIASADERQAQSLAAKVVARKLRRGYTLVEDHRAESDDDRDGEIWA